MNPLVQAQISRLRGNVKSLQDMMRETSEQLDRETRQADELLKKHWRAEKELTTLRRNQEEYLHLKSRLTEIEQAHREVEERAQALRARAQRLAQSLMP